MFLVEKDNHQTLIWCLEKIFGRKELLTYHILQRIFSRLILTGLVSILVNRHFHCFPDTYPRIMFECSWNKSQNVDNTFLNAKYYQHAFIRFLKNFLRRRELSSHRIWKSLFETHWFVDTVLYKQPFFKVFIYVCFNIFISTCRTSLIFYSRIDLNSDNVLHV